MLGKRRFFTFCGNKVDGSTKNIISKTVDQHVENYLLDEEITLIHCEITGVRDKMRLTDNSLVKSRVTSRTLIMH